MKILFAPMPAYPVVKSGILRLAPNAGYHRRRMCLHVFGAIVRQSAYESFTSKPSWKYLGNASDQRALPDESYSVYPLWWAQPSPINLYPVCVFFGDVFNTIDARSAPLPTPIVLHVVHRRCPRRKRIYFPLLHSRPSSASTSKMQVYG